LHIIFGFFIYSSILLILPSNIQYTVLGKIEKWGGGGGSLKHQKPKNKGPKKCHAWHKITNDSVLKMWLGIVKSTLPNHLMGPVYGFKMVPCTKSRIFEGPSIFWAPKWHSAGASCHLMGPKNLGPLENSRFCAGTI